eukprot:scaffold311622_cov28-Tisochrysis_lutea.AAC.4
MNRCGFYLGTFLRSWRISAIMGGLMASHRSTSAFRYNVFRLYSHGTNLSADGIGGNIIAQTSRSKPRGAKLVSQRPVDIDRGCGCRRATPDAVRDGSGGRFFKLNGLGQLLGLPTASANLCADFVSGSVIALLSAHGPLACELIQLFSRQSSRVGPSQG